MERDAAFFKIKKGPLLSYQKPLFSKSNSSQGFLEKQILIVRFSILVIFGLMSGCNPFATKDTHPEVPIIEELLVDNLAFVRLDTSPNQYIYLLKDDRVWETLSLKGDSISCKLYDLDGKVFFEHEIPGTSDYYIDSIGNIYMDQKCFPYPRFSPARPIEMIFLEDTLSQFLDSLNERFDSLATQKEDAYRAELMQHYGLTDCSYEDVHHSNCAYIAISKSRIISFGRPPILNFSKPMMQVRTFDEPCGISGGSGRLTFGKTTYYYELPNGLRFKSNHAPSNYSYTEVPNGLWLDFFEGQFLLRFEK